MKFGRIALLEVMSIVLDGLAHGKDISEMLRELDLVEQTEATLDGPNDIGKLALSAEYVRLHPRTVQHDPSDDKNRVN